MRGKIANDRSGFTIIELMLAMTIFSAVMVVVTVGFIGMNRTYNRGVIRKELSEQSQDLRNNLERTVRGAGGESVTIVDCSGGGESAPECNGLESGYSAICVGDRRYIWQPNTIDYGLKYDNRACGESIGGASSQIISSRYRVRSLNVNSLADAPSGLYRLKGVITTVDDEALSGLDGVDVRCKGSSESEFVRTCAVESLDFIISARSQDG